MAFSLGEDQSTLQQRLRSRSSSGPRRRVRMHRGSTPDYAVNRLFHVPVPMRDGVKLSADIYLPDAPGPFPTVLHRTPYDNSLSRVMTRGRDQVDRGFGFYPSRGYAFVAQDCRGRFDSEGVFYAWHDDITDGYDTQEWVGAQPWCDGNIGTVGSSYGALTQWLSAPLRSRYLRAMVPRVSQSDFWRETNYFGGAFSLALNLTWAFRNSGRTTQNMDHHDWDEVFRWLPLVDSARKAGRGVKFYQDWIEHPTYDDYWRQVSNLDKFHEIDVPVFNMGGYFDSYGNASFLNFCGMVDDGRTPQTRRSQKLLIGPWGHTLAASTRLGQLDFGPDSMVDLLEMELRWFDYWLKGIDNGVMDEPPIKLFVMGDNVWRLEHEWPLARTRFTEYYLHGDGGAGRLVSDGSLSEEPPGDEPADVYQYDPANPVPTLGGNHEVNPKIMPVGPWDQRPIEARQDVLVYTTAPLAADVEVTGPVEAKLFASSSAPDTDFTAHLVDVYPDGKAMIMCEGVLRARYRDSIERPALMEPDTVYEFRVEMGVTSNVFKRGHAIRLDISSSNFPRIDRNPNTGHPFGQDAELQVAEQAVHHTTRYPSRLVLPLIPRG